MKIICVDSNYRAHNAEMHHSEPTESPILFLKPETALARPGWPFFVPDFSAQVDYETELVVRINHLGKCIPERYAYRYYDEVTIGLSFTCRDLQRDLSARGLPWEVAKGFDGSAHVGRWITLSELADSRRPGIGGGEGVPSVQDVAAAEPSLWPLRFTMQLNGLQQLEGDTDRMLHSVDRIISYASRFYLLKTGDLIFTGTPAGVGPVHSGDLITAQLEGREVLRVRVK